MYSLYLLGLCLVCGLLIYGSAQENDGIGREGIATTTHSCDYIRSVPQNLRSASVMQPVGIDNFYQKYTEAYGIPVLGSVRVSDDALKRACYVVRFMFADREDIRNAFYNNYGRVAIMATSEVTLDIPEHKDFDPYWNERARGLGATPERPISTGAEENVLCLPGDRYSVEDIFLHELAHGLHLLGANYAIHDFDSRLRKIFSNARAAGKWDNTYAATNYEEYYAEGVQKYFNTDPYTNPPDGIHNQVNNNERLRNYDPDLHSMIHELFPCGNYYIPRCDKDRDAELAQVLTMNCGGHMTDNGCIDNNEQCKSWAKDNECVKNPAYMNVNCKKSCNKCGLGCVDDNVQCPFWAQSNECVKNPAYMNVNCKKSCNKCVQACADKGKLCAVWARSGDCESNPAYMKQNCKQSCKGCDV